MKKLSNNYTERKQQIIEIVKSKFDVVEVEVKSVQEKVDNWIEENKETPTERDFFTWLQGTEYCGSEIEDCGQSGQDYKKKLFKITFEDGEEDEFLLNMDVFYASL